MFVVMFLMISGIIMFTGGMFLAFAIVVICEYGGIFYSCNDLMVMIKIECVGIFVFIGGDIIVCEWNRNLFEFDWIGSVMFILFETAFLDGWIEVMFVVMDKIGVGM